jgi:hypothetical protein
MHTCEHPQGFEHPIAVRALSLKVPYLDTRAAQSAPAKAISKSKHRPAEWTARRLLRTRWYNTHYWSLHDPLAAQTVASNVECGKVHQRLEFYE